MKIRKQRRLIIKRMGAKALSFDHEGMYHTRQIKPCRSYSAGCSDCNAVLFRQTKGRFPHTYREFSEFEDVQQLADYYGDVDACIKKLQDELGDTAFARAMRELSYCPEGGVRYAYWTQVINKMGESK
jgi:hypothetical protein